MADVILLTDTVTNNVLGDSRYIGPYSLATSLEKSGFKVIVIDYFLRHPDFFSYLEKFISNETLFIGVSSTFLSKAVSYNNLKNNDYQKILIESVLAKDGNNRDQHHNHYRKKGLWLDHEDELTNWADNCKKILHSKNPAGKLIIGGAKATLLINQNIFRSFDFIALSTSEFSIVKFAQALKNKTEPEYRLQENYKILADQSVDLKDTCPQTIFTPLHAIGIKEALPIEISRGCAFNCKFCHYEKRESKRKNLNFLKEEMVRNYEYFGTQVYQFCDDCFNDSKVKVIETCTMLLSLPFKIEWVSYARVDVAIKFPETLAIMIESGAKGLFFGLESFNDTALKNAGKAVPSDLVKEFLIKTHKQYQTQCLFEGSFIVGLPGEDAESIEETIQWLVQNKPLDFISVARLYLQPYSAALDKTSMDYSDFSRSPQQYGITLQKSDWSHASMSSKEASALTEKFLSHWAHSGKNTILRNIFNYPILRTLGFTQAEIWDMARNETRASTWGMEANSRYVRFLDKYWNTLEEHNLGK